jgi:hypothetical protein
MPDQDGSPTFAEWRSDLSAADRERVDSLVERLGESGAHAPESWARSEVSENFAQSARFAFLRAVWRDLERWRDPGFVDRYIGDLAVDDDVRAQLRATLAHVAFESVLSVVMVIDNGEDIGGLGEMPGWVLSETDSDCRRTGRDVVGLHESLLEVDPLGIEAEDIRGF